MQEDTVHQEPNGTPPVRDKRKLLQLGILILTVYVGASLTSLLNDPARTNKPSAVIEADQSELTLRLASWIESISHEAPKAFSAGFDKDKLEVLEDADNALKRVYQDDPSNPGTIAKRIMVADEMRKPTSSFIKDLERTLAASKAASAGKLTAGSDNSGNGSPLHGSNANSSSPSNETPVDASKVNGAGNAVGSTTVKSASSASSNGSGASSGSNANGGISPGSGVSPNSGISPSSGVSPSTSSNKDSQGSGATNGGSNSSALVLPEVVLAIHKAPRGGIPRAEAQKLENQIDTLTPGWYKDKVLIELYKISNQPSKLSARLKQFAEHNDALSWKLVCVSALFGFLTLMGLVINIAILATSPRKITPDRDLPMIRPPAHWDFTTVFGVFIFWLATQITISYVAQGALHGLRLLNYGVSVAALGTMFLYMVQTGPALLYIYFLALKPNGARFFEGIKLRPKVGTLTTAKLVACGVITWLAAMPLVIVCYIVAVLVFHSHGSTNPIIALVMEAARSSNPIATAIFYFTVGVLAPFCEETLFRGFLYSALRQRLSILPSVIISGVLFGAVHLDAGALLPLCCLGMLFAYVFERTKSTLPSMVAHGLWNSATFTLVLFLFGN